MKSSKGVNKTTHDNYRDRKEWQDFSKLLQVDKKGNELEGKGDYHKRKKHLQMLKKKGLCFTCEKDYVSGKHECDKKDKNKDDGKLSFNSINRNSKIDNLLLESNLPLSKDNLSDIVPITLDGHQIFAYVDNGANFSLIHPSIC
jgi:hypothetical protein